MGVASATGFILYSFTEWYLSCLPNAYPSKDAFKEKLLKHKKCELKETKVQYKQELYTKTKKQD